MFKHKYDNRFILADRKSIEIDSFKTQRNNNVCICGSPGTGKTRSYLLPNLLNEVDQNYIVVDIKGDILKNTAASFAKRGYKIQILNLKDPEQSYSYNPFDYIQNEIDVCTVVDAIVAEKKESHADPFWKTSEKMLLQAIFFYLFYECRQEDKTISNVLKLLRLAEIKENNTTFASTLDIMFSELEKKNPDHIAVKQYKSFNSGADKTLKSIIISAYSDLFLFNLNTIQKLTDTNEIDFHLFNTQKTILYVILNDVDSSLYPIANIFLTQAFQQLTKIADSNQDSRFNIPIHIFLDDFCSYIIKDFDILIACLRSRNIGISIILQSETQLIANYGDAKAKSIINCCDTYLYLGGSDMNTIQNIAKKSNSTVKKILEMPLSNVFIFRRGEAVHKGKIFNFTKSDFYNECSSNSSSFNINDYIHIKPRRNIFKKNRNEIKIKRDIKQIENIEQYFFDANKIDSLVEDAEFELKDQSSWFLLDENPQKNGILFEKELGEIFKEKGYLVETTPSSNDFGADLIVEKDGIKYCVQAKFRSNSMVSLTAVQEVIGAIKYYQADKGIVITNGIFTTAAKKLAKSNDVILINGSDLNEIRNSLF